MGGKWRLAPWIISYFPIHRVYVEPFGGGASVLLRKPRSYGEVYNDLDGEAVNLFRVLRDPVLAGELIRMIEMTPYARAELEAAYPVVEDPVERARRLVVLSHMGFGSNAHARRPTGFRANSNRLGPVPSQDWRNLPDALRLVVDRLRGVTIENREAKAVMAQHDSPQTLHYVDPPYIHSVRGRGNKDDVAYRGYAVELSDDDHIDLLAFLNKLAGVVVLSGYSHPIYEERLGAWARVEKDTYADGARKRCEVLWINRLEALPMFREAHA